MRLNEENWNLCLFVIDQYQSEYLHIVLMQLYTKVITKIIIPKFEINVDNNDLIEGWREDLVVEGCQVEQVLDIKK